MQDFGAHSQSGNVTKGSLYVSIIQVTLKTVPMFGHLGEIDQLCNGKKLQN